MRRLISLTLLAVGWVLGGCVANEAELDLLEESSTEDFEDELEDEDELGKADALGLPLRFLPGNLVLPTHTLNAEVRRVFKSADELEQTLQIANPGIDFEHEWAVFYNPGLSTLQPGSRARIETVSLSLTGLTLKVTTALEHNGADCPTRSTRPFLLVAVPIPDEPPPYTRFYRADRTRVCTLEYYDGVPFTAAEVQGALRASNEATLAELDEAGIKGTQAKIIVQGRTWHSLAAVADTTGIGPITMNKLRTLGASF